MASIFILAVAIIPMVAMFDSGLNAATTSSKYDKARTLANLKLEEAKGLSYDTAKDGFPVAGTTPSPSTGIYEDSSWRTYTGANSSDFSGFGFKVRKQFMAQPTVSPTGFSEENFGYGTEDKRLMKVTVTVQWDGSKTYSTSGVLAG